MSFTRIFSTCGVFLALGLRVTAAQPTSSAARADSSARSPLAGAYTLVAIDNHALPYTPAHEGAPPNAQLPEVLASTLIVRADGSFIQAMGYRLTVGGTQRITVQPFSGRCYPDGDAFVAQWDGAGRTRVTFERDTLVIDNAGVRLQYRKGR